MNNRQVAEAFAQGNKEKGTGSNLFYEKYNTIYSYGYHYPIAYKTTVFKDAKEIVIFNDNGYSGSTAKHEAYVRSALSNYHIVRTIHIKQFIREFENLDLKGISKELKDRINKEIDSRFDEARVKEKRARKHKDMWAYVLEKEIAQARAFNNIVYIPLNKSMELEHDLQARFA